MPILRRFSAKPAIRLCRPAVHCNGTIAKHTMANSQLAVRSSRFPARAPAITRAVESSREVNARSRRRRPSSLRKVRAKFARLRHRALIVALISHFLHIRQSQRGRRYSRTRPSLSAPRPYLHPSGRLRLFAEHIDDVSRSDSPWFASGVQRCRAA